eukprot:jgi/Tetstr1/423739/TSEL_014371.t1
MSSATVKILRPEALAFAMISMASDESLVCEGSKRRPGIAVAAAVLLSRLLLILNITDALSRWEMRLELSTRRNLNFAGSGWRVESLLSACLLSQVGSFHVGSRSFPSTTESGGIVEPSASVVRKLPEDLLQRVNQTLSQRSVGH